MRIHSGEHYFAYVCEKFVHKLFELHVFYLNMELDKEETGYLLRNKMFVENLNVKFRLTQAIAITKSNQINGNQVNIYNHFVKSFRIDL